MGIKMKTTLDTNGLVVVYEDTNDIMGFDVTIHTQCKEHNSKLYISKEQFVEMVNELVEMKRVITCSN